MVNINEFNRVMHWVDTHKIINRIITIKVIETLGMINSVKFIGPVVMSGESYKSYIRKFEIEVGDENYILEVESLRYMIKDKFDTSTAPITTLHITNMETNERIDVHLGKIDANLPLTF